MLPDLNVERATELGLVKENFRQPDRMIGRVRPEEAREFFLGAEPTDEIQEFYDNFDRLYADQDEGIALKPLPVITRSYGLLYLTRYTNQDGDLVRSITVPPRKENIAVNSHAQRAISLIQSEWGIYGERHLYELRGARGFQLPSCRFNVLDKRLFGFLAEARPFQGYLQSLLSA
jgi:hypothetical protein